MSCVALFAIESIMVVVISYTRMTVPVAFNSQVFETSQLCEQSVYALTNLLTSVERGEHNGMAQYICIPLEHVCVGQRWL